MAKRNAILAWVWCVEGWQQDIRQIIGSFDFAAMCDLQAVLMDTAPIPTVPEIEPTDENPNPPTERLCEVIWCDGETQYGSGYGDVYNIARHYDIEPTEVVR